MFIETYGEEGEEWDVFRVVDGEFPTIDEVRHYDGFVISGSPYDAHGCHDWIIRLTFLVQILDALEKKVLGICFGHQLICRALGGKVGRASRGWDIGLREVKIKKEITTTLWGSLGDEIPSSLPIIEIHQDEVLEPPAGAQVVGSSDRTAVEMFTVGDHILGIQGHPEYNKDILFNLIDRLLDNNEVEEEIAEKAKSHVMEVVEPDRKSWEKICRSFLRGRNELVAYYK